MNVESLINCLEKQLSIQALYDEIRIEMDDFYVLGRTKGVSPLFVEKYDNYNLSNATLALFLKDSTLIGPRSYFIEYIMQYLDFFDEWGIDARAQEVIENLSDSYTGYMATEHNIYNAIKYLEGRSSRLLLSSSVSHTK